MAVINLTAVEHNVKANAFGYVDVVLASEAVDDDLAGDIAKDSQVVAVHGHADSVPVLSRWDDLDVVATSRGGEDEGAVVESGVERGTRVFDKPCAAPKSACQ